MEVGLEIVVKGREAYLAGGASSAYFWLASPFPPCIGGWRHGNCWSCRIDEVSRHHGRRNRLCPVSVNEGHRPLWDMKLSVSDQHGGGLCGYRRAVAGFMRIVLGTGASIRTTGQITDRLDTYMALCGNVELST